MGKITITRRQLLAGMTGLSVLALSGAGYVRASGSPARPLIIGIKGTVLNDEQRALIEEIRPTGIILYRYNIIDPGQLVALTHSLRKLCGEQLLIMLDSEGGRIVRLRPPHWRLFLGPSDLGIIYGRNREEGERATYLTYRLMGQQLADMGINTNLAPVLDLQHPGTFAHSDYRSFGRDPQQVAHLAGIACRATLEAGVIPVLKHIPGQGRVKVNSDTELVNITASRQELASDLAPFKALADMPMAMVSNVIYDALDPERPACLSPHVIRMIREEMGYKGLLLTDDLGTQVMRVRDRATTIRAAQSAGNDLLQYTFGLVEKGQGEAFLPPASEAANAQVARALTMARDAYVARDTAGQQAELDALIKRHQR